MIFIFAGRYEAIVWICKNQLGRCNLTDAQKTYLIGRQYEAQKMTAGGDRKSEEFSKDQNGPLKKFENIAQKVAADIGVGEQTVKRAAKFSEGVDAAEKIESGAREAILSGKSKVPKSVIAELPEMQPEEQLDVIEAAKEGWAWVSNGRARKRFNDNRQRFVEGEDYFKITPSEFRTAIGDMDSRQQNDVTLITESGYLMIVKNPSTTTVHGRYSTF